jgi:hypothetical protein
MNVSEMNVSEMIGSIFRKETRMRMKKISTSKINCGGKHDYTTDERHLI